MKSVSFVVIILFIAVTCQADLPMTHPPGLSPTAVTNQGNNDAVNYTIRVEWKDAKKGASSIQLETTEGQFELDTLSGTTKINDTDIPNTIKLNGTLTELSTEKGRLALFLGRTVPYVSSTYAGNSSSYAQLSVGLQSTFIVTFGKPLIIQTDDNGTVSILVKREDK
jgi:hypothetical protein